MHDKHSRKTLDRLFLDIIRTQFDLICHNVSHRLWRSSRWSDCCCCKECCVRRLRGELIGVKIDERTIRVNGHRSCRLFQLIPELLIKLEDDRDQGEHTDKYRDRRAL